MSIWFYKLNKWLGCKSKPNRLAGAKGGKIDVKSKQTKKAFRRKRKNMARLRHLPNAYQLTPTKRHGVSGKSIG